MSHPPPGRLGLRVPHYCPSTGGTYLAGHMPRRGCPGSSNRRPSVRLPTLARLPYLPLLLQPVKLALHLSLIRAGQLSEVGGGRASFVIKRQPELLVGLLRLGRLRCFAFGPVGVGVRILSGVSEPTRLRVTLDY